MSHQYAIHQLIALSAVAAQQLAYYEPGYPHGPAMRVDPPLWHCHHEHPVAPISTLEPFATASPGLPEGNWFRDDIHQAMLTLEKPACGVWDQTARAATCADLWSKMGSKLETPYNQLRSIGAPCSEAAVTYESTASQQFGLIFHWEVSKAAGVGITQSGQPFCFGTSATALGISLTGGVEWHDSISKTKFGDYRRIEGPSTSSQWSGGPELEAGFGVGATFGSYNVAVDDGLGGKGLKVGVGQEWAASFGLGVGIGVVDASFTWAQSSPLVQLGATTANDGWIFRSGLARLPVQDGTLLAGKEPKPCDPPPSCFDASTELFTAKGPLRADNVSVGDEVLVATSTGELVFDQVALVIQHPNVSAIEYVDITTSTRTIHLTSDHYLHAVNSSSKLQCCTGATLKTAGAVAVGDTVWISSDDGRRLVAETVVLVTRSMREGAYNFVMRQHGAPSFHSLIANGVAASSFTTEWRLLNESDPSSFDLSDAMADPLRNLYEAWIGFNGKASSLDGESMIALALGMQTIVADCVEANMTGCSEDEVARKVDGVIATTLSQAASRIHQDANQTIRELVPPDLALTVVEAAGALSRNGEAFLPRAARRLATWVAPRLVRAIPHAHRLMPRRLSSHLQELVSRATVGAVAQALVDDAAHVCEKQQAKHVVHVHITHTKMPAWVLPIIFVTVTFAVTTLALLIILIRVVRRMHKRATRATTHPTATKEKETVPAAHVSVEVEEQANSNNV